MCSTSSNIDTPPESEPCYSSSVTGMITPIFKMSSGNIESPCSCSAQRAGAADTPPFPGSTYAIRECNTGRYITLVEGELRALQNVGDQGGWHWVCIETNGWLGFRNPVSSTHIGHDTKHNYWAQYKHHLSHESFCARKHPDGGYVLLSRQDEELWKMSVGEDFGLVETKKDGARWEFIKV
ncbi:uncharacterized protein F4812DRAFT_461241 [Daldinia caldariorum]|uniref:uncharacterized protein n=1 Tax=Daldinia caldariorum TaxID=326644 RepID=UPI002007522F|nr:uncharacterized protein F4812DRAFT_461241 [Daldinia caldariorum]KAI1466271.1 hypothetical protein F4812DRAFT_461241 [Daldinia caldariorum]